MRCRPSVALAVPVDLVAVDLDRHRAGVKHLVFADRVAAPFQAILALDLADLAVVTRLKAAFVVVHPDRLPKL